MPHNLRLVEGHKSLAVCELVGRIDALNSSALKKELAAFVDQNKPRLIIQAQELEFIAACGLNVLLDFAQKARSRKGGMKLVAPSSNVRRILDLVRFSSLFDVLDSEQAAIAAFTGPA